MKSHGDGYMRKTNAFRWEQRLPRFSKFSVSSCWGFCSLPNLTPLHITWTFWRLQLRVSAWSPGVSNWDKMTSAHYCKAALHSISCKNKLGQFPKHSITLQQYQMQVCLQSILLFHWDKSHTIKFTLLMCLIQWFFSN